MIFFPSLAVLSFVVLQGTPAVSPPVTPTNAAPAAPSTDATHAQSEPPKPVPSGPATQSDAPNRPAPAWRPVDRIVMIVNDDMLSSRTLQRDLDRYLKQSNASKKDAPNILMEIQRERVRRLLEVQAGQDMGLDPAVVKHQIDENVELLIRERFNGAAGLSDYLQSKDLDTSELREQFKNQIYAEFWEKYITGEGAVPGQRISRDRYIRPGILQLYFENGIRNPDNLDQIGGKQQEVILQYLFIDEQQHGGEEQAKNLLKTLRQRIVDGEDMGDICEKYSAQRSAKKDRGLMESRPEARFADLDPAIGIFLKSAKPGDVSELMLYATPRAPGTEDDGKRYWRIIKLVERTPPVLPELASADVQQKLMLRIQEDYAQIRKGSALQQLFQGSYVWPPELATPQQR